MFITLLFIYPVSFMFCLRSNTENNIVSLVNLSLHFQGWCLTSKCLLCTPINELCYQNITTDLHPRKMLTVRTGENFVLIFAVNSTGRKVILHTVFCLSCL